MGLLGRWRAGREAARAQTGEPPRPEPRASRHLADPVTGRLITPGEQTDVRRPTPVAPPAAPPAGGLVVGSAELREQPVETPAFYVPEPEPPRPSPPDSPAAVFGPAEPYDREVVRKAFDQVSDRADRLIRDFYAELFVRLGSEAFGMFPASMVDQREDFGRALVQWVVADDPDALHAHLAQLGADHRKFAVEPRHYTIAGQAMVSAWKNLAGTSWTPEVEHAVVNSYVRLATTMIDGALRANEQPATWGATVIGHTRVLADFAVLRVQPDAPYPYKPGQYLTVESPLHPKLWRQMSVASAPRPDNTLDLHVRAVGATGVSAALVGHTKVGDRLRLGPPRGNGLVIEPGTVSGGVLCVCSGTGAAPISAVVQSMLTWPECPELYAFVGGRTRADMYPVEHLAALARAGGRADRIQVYGVVSDDPGYTGYRGRVEHLVPRLRNWAKLGVDVLVSGPDTMIATAVLGLTDSGVPLERIHFDQYDLAA